MRPNTFSPQIPPTKDEKSITMPIISRIRRFIQGSTKISPDIYQITVMGANMYLIVEEKLTLIDAGYRGSTPPIMNYIREVGRSPSEVELIIITHNHIDHVGSLTEIKRITGARVAMHETDIGERKSLPSAKPEDIDILLRGGEILDVLGGTEVIHTPGHTPGSICLYSRQNKLLIVGDALRKRRNVIHIPDKSISFDLNLAAESARKLAQLDCETICFGHGLPLTDDVYGRMQDLVSRISSD
jgi:glyoxylase-like metal-dependent hydrolase (beta-lactamase superfamily II)